MSHSLSKKTLLNIAGKFGSPVYVYHAEKITEQYHKLTQAFKGSNAKFFYACKALTNINILKLVKEMGASLDCVSINEVMLGIKAGFAPYDILFTPTALTLKK